MELPDKTALRNSVRRRRRQLSPAQQAASSHAIAHHIAHHPRWQLAQSVAFYLCEDGEPELFPLLRQAQLQGKRCYLPFCHEQRLDFIHYQLGDPLVVNRFGIAEPLPTRATPITELDWVLCPLVAFDDVGQRLGMGAGFYDRSLAHKAQQPAAKPLLIGVAHSTQQCATLPTDRWDIPLDGLATEQGLRFFGAKQ